VLGWAFLSVRADFGVFESQRRTDWAERFPETVDVPLNTSSGLPRLHVLDIIGDDFRNGGLGGKGIITPSVKRGFQLTELVLCKLQG